jgi:hypothetical protein
MRNYRWKTRILLYALFVGVVLIAVVGWTVQGLRWTRGGARRLAPAT